MSENRHEVLCWNCRKKVTYTIKARKDIQNIKGIDYQYNERFAICNECKEEIWKNIILRKDLCQICLD